MEHILSKRTGTLALVGLLAVAGCGGSDGTSYGTIRGTVTNASSKAVSGAKVTPSCDTGRTTTTAADGTYSVTVPTGSCRVAFSADSYEPATSDSVNVAGGETATVDQVLQPSALTVTVNLPAALKDGGPSGFEVTTDAITATAQLNGAEVQPTSIAWSVTAFDGLAEAPGAASLTAASGASTQLNVPGFDAIREGANAWMNATYHRTSSTAFEYIQVPARTQLLPFSPQQVQAMSFLVRATVTAGGRTSSGSALVSPVTVSTGSNDQPKGLLVVANAPQATGNSWELKYLPPGAATLAWQDAPAGVALSSTSAKNPTLLPTVKGLYRLTNGSDTLYVRVSSFHGSGTTAAEEGEDGIACASCHSGEFAIDDQFTAWNSSAHANMNFDDPFSPKMSLFEAGVRGKLSHYGEACISCHVVGQNKAASADNRGFDDVAAEVGWTWPATLGDEAWATVTAHGGLAQRASIRCESCHGPLQGEDHGQAHVTGNFGLFGLAAPTASLDAGICMSCHDELPYHDRGSLWTASGHANVELAMEDATVENRPVTFSNNSVSGVAHCGRCHAAEGFALYLPQQQGKSCTDLPATQAGRPAYIRIVNDDGTCTAIDGSNLPAANTFFTQAGLTKGRVHSQTCQVCHDPHTTQLRLQGDTGMVAAGFSYAGAGTGALCIVCHNSRIASAVYANSASTRYAAPHSAGQGDVFAGRNAYYYGVASGASADTLTYKTAHSFMGNACADCHMNYVPEDIASDFQVNSTNHTFKTSLKVCAECHAEGIGEKVQAQVEGKMDTLSTKLRTLFMNKMNAAGIGTMTANNAADGAIAETTFTLATIPAPAAGDTLPVTNVELVEFHGQPALIVTATVGGTTTVFGANVSSFKTAAGASAFAPAADEDGESIMAKSYYNYLLLHGGAAEGVHNPAFVNGVLDATLARLNTLTSVSQY